MRNKPLKGLMGQSPIKKIPRHPNAPTEEQAKKSKGTLKPGRLINHGRWDRPEIFKETKRIFSKKFNTLKNKLGY